MSKNKKYLTIESGIPVPPDYPTLLREARTTLKALQPGDSFLFPIQNWTFEEKMDAKAEKLGYEITVVKEGSGVRVWRTK